MLTYSPNGRASRLGREHHDDLAHFMVGMGYAKEALHLPGISKRSNLDSLCSFYISLLPSISRGQIMCITISSLSPLFETWSSSPTS